MAFRPAAAGAGFSVGLLLGVLCHIRHICRKQLLRSKKQFAKNPCLCPHSWTVASRTSDLWHKKLQSGHASGAQSASGAKPPRSPLLRRSPAKPGSPPIARNRSRFMKRFGKASVQLKFLKCCQTSLRSSRPGSWTLLCSTMWCGQRTCPSMRSACSTCLRAFIGHQPGQIWLPR